MSPIPREETIHSTPLTVKDLICVRRQKDVRIKGNDM